MPLLLIYLREFTLTPLLLHLVYDFCACDYTKAVRSVFSATAALLVSAVRTSTVLVFLTAFYCILYNIIMLPPGVFN